MNLNNIVNHKNVTIVDVREPFEFMLGHVAGAINIPLRNVMSRKEEFRVMAKPLVVYCRSGSRSQQAQLVLTASGVDEVYNGGSLKEMRNLLTVTA